MLVYRGHSKEDCQTFAEFIKDGYGYGFTEQLENDLAAHHISYKQIEQGSIRFYIINSTTVKICFCMKVITEEDETVPYTVTGKLLLYPNTTGVNVNSVSRGTTVDSETGVRLDENLIPTWTDEEMEQEAERFLKSRMSIPPMRPGQTDPFYILQKMQIRDEYVKWNGSQPARSIIEPSNNYTDSFRLMNNVIQVNMNVINSLDSQTYAYALLHECVHLEYHRLHELGKLFYRRMCGKCGSEIEFAPINGVKTIDAMERQAEIFAFMLSMPAYTLRPYWESVSEPDYDVTDIMRLVEEAAMKYRVSFDSMRIRLGMLGYKEVLSLPVSNQNDFTVLNGFQKLVLPDFDYQATIARIVKEAVENEQFAHIVMSGSFVLADNRYVLRKSKYVRKRNGEYHLTREAKTNPSECCIYFPFTICREETSALYCTLPTSENASFAYSAEMAAVLKKLDIRGSYEESEKLLKWLPGMFEETLNYHMTRLRVTTEQLSEVSGLSLRTIKRMRGHYRGSCSYHVKEILIIGICLHLNYELLEDLFKKAHIRYGICPYEKTVLFCYHLCYNGTVTSFNQALEDCGLDPLPYANDSIRCGM